MAAASIARVLVESPLPQLDRLFDYRIPEALVEWAKPGVRVRVPLRSAGRVADGYLIELAEHADFEGELAELDSVVSPVPVLAPEVWALARRAADRAAGSASDILRLGVPRRQVRVERAWLAREDHQPLPEVDDPGFRDHGDALADVIAEGRRAVVDASPGVEQTAAGEWIGRWARTAAEAAAHAVSRNTSAIIAVPDHRDQWQLEAALAQLLPPERIVRVDARQTGAERGRAHLRCLGDDALVIIGTRAALYAPSRRLGVILIWDDGDSLHAEQHAPYVHSRDLALIRQEQQGCALVLLGHARSTEAQRLVELGWAQSITPVRSAAPRVLPTAQQVGDDRLAATARIPSSAWNTARAALEAGPVLVQVARPGYAPGMACVDCGQLARCRRCEGPIVQRAARAVPSCVWCGALATDWRCPHCEGTRMRRVGAGTARTAEDLGRAFPGVRVIIADGDHRVLTVDDSPALIIATRGAEPVAAGGYRAVLLLDGERMLARESLRVAEDCVRWWANAAALAAPGATTVLVGVGGPLATAFATWRLADFAAAELADRRRLRFPPAVRVASLTGSVAAVEAAVGALEEPGIDVLGPVDIGPDSVRAIIRFEYAAGASVAKELRTQVILAATRRRKAVAGRRRGTPPPSLRVRFDDNEPFGD